MTTSFEVEQASTGASGMPARDSEGMQTWNPSVGIYFKPAEIKRESYGGIIGALQDLHVQSTGFTKAYPENFAGIIAAIKDLALGEYKPGSDTGPKPPNLEINIDIDTGLPIYDNTYPPVNGQLWFDTRQGRLFVWVDDDWYQTNGADGLPIITAESVPPPMQIVVPGQFWWDSTHNSLYIHDGYYQKPDGTISQDPTGAKPVWKLVADMDENYLQTTATLPLSVIGPRVAALEDYTYLPDIDFTDDDGNAIMSVQKDYNEWLFQALLLLNDGLESFQPVIIDEAPPDLPEVGQLWYDTETLDMSIWYDDGNTQQWVPVSSAYSYDADLDVVRSAISTETRLRESAIHDIYQVLANVNTQDETDISALEASVTALQQQVNGIPIVNASKYIEEAYFKVREGLLQASIEEIKDGTPDYSTFALNTALNSLESRVNSLPTMTEVEAAIPAPTDLSDYSTKDFVTSSIADISVDFLPRNGGILTGSFQIENNDYSTAAFDFSSSSWGSRNAFKFQANGGTNAYTTFGTTDVNWEYAWKFNNDEDFCWINGDGNKVFSITKEGPACSTLYVGDLGLDTSNRRVIHNKIDVKEQLKKYQTVLETLRQKVSSSHDFDSLKSNILSALATV